MPPSKSKSEIEVEHLGYENILRNLPGNPRWEGSFYEQLTEHGRWDIDEFWILHLALTEAAIALSQSDMIKKEIALSVVTLQSKVSHLLIAHFNENDVFEISNLSVDELIDFRERFYLAVISVFSGEVIPESSFDLANPLIVGEKQGKCKQT
jgi:Immunity protein 41